jgi:adenylate cyclase
LAIGAVIILGGGALAAWYVYFRPAPPPAEVASEQPPTPKAEEAPPPIPAEPSIAVLPFANISSDPKEDYLSDGITEQIITALSKVPQLLVIARNSVFTYKGKPVMIQQVSEELGVRYVLEGSVQKSGDRLRITAQLIDAKTGNHIWSERYDRDLKDLFALQDDITKNIIAALQVKLTQRVLAGKDTNNLDAYLKVMKGQYHQWRFSKNDNEISVQLAKEAIELDPSYASAYLLLAWNYFLEASFGWVDTPWQSYEKAIELAKKAISLSSGKEAGAYMALANFYARTYQSEEALRAGKKGLSIDPASSTVNALYGNMLYQLHKFREAIPFFKKAIRTDPKPPSWVLNQLGASYFNMGQFKEANQVLKEAISVDPEPSSWGLYLLGASYYRMGKSKEAIPFLKKAIRMNPEPPTWYLNFLGWCYYEMGSSYYETGQFNDAIPVLKDAINLSYLNLEANVVLAAAYSLTGRTEDARARAAEVLKINPKFSLEDIVENDYYDFLKADKECFINALRKAGLK